MIYWLKISLVLICLELVKLLGCYELIIICWFIFYWVGGLKKLLEVKNVFGKILKILGEILIGL